MTRLKQ